MIPKIKDICKGSNQEILQLFGDKSFKIVNGSKTGESFDLSDFAFPSDGATCVGINVDMDGGELVLFDNEILTIGSPEVELTPKSLYARGILLKITYPDSDDNGEEIDIADKSVELWIEDAETLQFKKYPLYNFFSIFTNPNSNVPSDLINRIKIINPNDLFNVKVNGLVIYGKAQ